MRFCGVCCVLGIVTGSPSRPIILYFLNRHNLQGYYKDGILISIHFLVLDMPPRLEIDVDPVEHITADAIGKPGQRVFYIQAWQQERTVSVLLEKFQLQSLGAGIEQFLGELLTQNPELSDVPSDFNEEKMHISPPVEPLFRVGEIGLGYDKDRDMVVLIVRELLTEDADPETAGVVRYWCSRLQLRSMALWSAEVVKRGRPICPQCGQPMEPEGHFCPKKNGHKH
jgi:uncharacterized repeat protein (TIGR03847 family)